MEKKPVATKEQLEEIAKTYPTPFYLYDEKGIRENARKLKEAFAWNPGFKEYFAVKATPNPFILKILKETILTMTNNLIVLLGPTGVGKTDLSIAMSKEFDAPIVSSDSLQISSEMTVGTDVP